MSPKYMEFHSPTKILSGELALEQIACEMGAMNVRYPLLLSDTQLERLGVVDIVTDAMAAQGLVCTSKITDIPPDSSIAAVNTIAAYYRQLSCDSIIAVGGGSVLDTAKGVRMVISQDAQDIMTLMGCDTLVRGKYVPLVAVPTTAGTGAEATAVAVIRDEDKQVKMEFISGSIQPDVAVLDVRMTAKLPLRISASTGMDALCHAIEAYTCLQHNPISDAYATGAIELIAHCLPLAVQGKGGKDARMGMANAALMAGIAFSNAMVGGVHAIGHALGGVCRVPHADAMAILLPHVMRKNMPVCAERYGKLLLYLSGTDVYARTPVSERAACCLNHVESLLSSLHDQCGLPLNLTQVGVKAGDHEEIAIKALNDGAMIVNPVSFSLHDVLEILKMAS